VRLVSARPSGEFFPGECLYGTGATPRLLDLLSISFDRPAKEDHQQENHIVAAEPWILSGRLAYEDLSPFVDIGRIHKINSPRLGSFRELVGKL